MIRRDGELGTISSDDKKRRGPCFPAESSVCVCLEFVLENVFEFV